MYTQFTVSTGVVKKANQVLINSNKLTSVFYNIGKTFNVAIKDIPEVSKILDRNIITMKFN